MAVPPVLLLIAVGVAAFLLAGDKDKGLKPGKKPGEEMISPEELGFLKRAEDGSLHYKQDAPTMNFGAMALMTKSVGNTPTQGLYHMVQHDPLNGDNVPQGQVDNTFVANAYEGARDLHSRGFDIWLSPTIFQGPTANVPRDLYASPAGMKIPSNAVLALFRAAKDPWLTEENPPTQLFPAPPVA